MSLSEQIIDRDYFQDLKFKISHNYQIADFYYGKYEETGEEKFLNKSKFIDGCCKLWDVDFFQQLKVKNIKRVNLCKDKFCFNCQSMLAVKRQLQFGPILDMHRQDYDVYHLVVTVPNCGGEELKALIKKMYKKFPFLLRYFRGKAKVKNINFLQYGYAGAVRALEVTQNQETKEFHPHFHCMVLLKKGLNLEGEICNAYSYGKENGFHKFSKLEILLQKIWWLLMNDERVTAKAIEELKQGYDVYLTDSEGYYHEVFKYACKGAFDPDKGAFLYKEQTFWTLYGALNNRRMIQGYGKLYNFNDLDGDILDDEATDLYERIISALIDFEKPIFKVESLDEVIDNSVFCKYISKSNLKRLIIARKDEILAKHKLLADSIDEKFFD